MKFIGYILITLDFILGNCHWFWVMYPASVEWYTQDTAAMTRVSLWSTAITIVLFRLLLYKKSIVLWFTRAQLWTLFVWILFGYIDIVLTATGLNRGMNPTPLLIVFVCVAFIIHFYFYVKDEYDKS